MATVRRKEWSEIPEHRRIACLAVVIHHESNESRN
jgi:hypothetical protein